MLYKVYDVCIVIHYAIRRRSEIELLSEVVIAVCIYLHSQCEQMDLACCEHLAVSY